jgi:hypothetical protein
MLSSPSPTQPDTHSQCERRKNIHNLLAGSRPTAINSVLSHYQCPCGNNMHQNRQKLLNSLVSNYRTAMYRLRTGHERSKQAVINLICSYTPRCNLSSLCTPRVVDQVIQSIIYISNKWNILYFSLFFQFCIIRTLCGVLQLLVVVYAVPCSLTLYTMMMEEIRFLRYVGYWKELHGVTSQKTAFFIVTAVKTSNHT